MYTLPFHLKTENIFPKLLASYFLSSSSYGKHIPYITDTIVIFAFSLPSHFLRAKCTKQNASKPMFCLSADLSPIYIPSLQFHINTLRLLQQIHLKGQLDIQFRNQLGAGGGKSVERLLTHYCTLATVQFS